MNVKRILLAGSVAIVLAAASERCFAAAPVTWSGDFSPALAIPDNDPTGVADTEIVAIPGIDHILGLQVSLDIAGGFNGDFYAYLRHGGTGFAILLNRVGRSSANPFGYADSRLDINLSDAAPNGDVHLYQTVLNPNGGTLTGDWRPDGRNADPTLVSDLTAPTALLSDFDGLDPNGLWTLFVSDNSPLGIGTIEGWGLTIVGDQVGPLAVPESGATLTLLMLSTIMLGLLHANARFCKSPRFSNCEDDDDDEQRKTRVSRSITA